MGINSKDRPGKIIYLSHGGGPLPLMGDSGHQEMISFMKKIPELIEKPESILVFSAHWEESQPRVIGGETTPLFYDYYGFPPETYQWKYPAPGSPVLADKIIGLLENAAIDSGLEHKRGFDHGVFVPLKLIYPEGEIPIVQVSLKRGLDPAEHIHLGKALKSLRDEKILVIGSGFSFHNMSAFQWSGSPENDRENHAFQDWLIQVCTKKLSTLEREEALIQWESAPHSRYCHPREEHLIPLHVCAGMAESPAELVFDGTILGKRSVAFLW